MIGQHHRVASRIESEQPAVVGPDAAFLVALIDFPEQSLKVLPQRLGQPLVARLRGTLEQPIRQEVRALSEGNEQDAVEQLLRELDRCGMGKFRAAGRIDEKGDQAFTHRLVFVIQLVRYVLVSIVCVAQERIGRAAQQAVGRQDQPEAGVLNGIVQACEIEHLVRVAPSAEAIKPDFDAVRNENPAGAWSVYGVVPRLLHWAAATTGRDGVKVFRCGTLQLKGCNDLFGPSRCPEAAERDIDRASANRALECKRIGVFRIECCVAQDFVQHGFEEEVADGRFLLLPEPCASRLPCIVARRRKLLVRGREYGALTRSADGLWLKSATRWVRGSRGRPELPDPPSTRSTPAAAKRSITNPAI